MKQSKTFIEQQIKLGRIEKVNSTIFASLGIHCFTKTDINESIIDELNEASAQKESINQYIVWIFEDNSYVELLNDAYYAGDEVGEILSEITNEEN